MTPNQPCEKCEYDLAGLGMPGDAVICPECGTLQVLGKRGLRPRIGWGQMLGWLALPWMLLPFFVCFGWAGVLGPAAMSGVFALGFADRFTPTQRLSRFTRYAAAAGLWVLITIAGGAATLFIVWLASPYL